MILQLVRSPFFTKTVWIYSLSQHFGLQTFIAKKQRIHRFFNVIIYWPQKSRSKFLLVFLLAIWFIGKHINHICFSLDIDVEVQFWIPLINIYYTSERWDLWFHPLRLLIASDGNLSLISHNLRVHSSFPDMNDVQNKPPRLSYVIISQTLSSKLARLQCLRIILLWVSWRLKPNFNKSLAHKQWKIWHNNILFHINGADFGGPKQGERSRDKYHIH